MPLNQSSIERTSLQRFTMQSLHLSQHLSPTTSLDYVYIQTSYKPVSFDVINTFPGQPERAKRSSWCMLSGWKG